MMMWMRMRDRMEGVDVRMTVRRRRVCDPAQESWIRKSEVVRGGD
jgi:hypothetical protein